MEHLPDQFAWKYLDYLKAIAFKVGRDWKLCIGQHTPRCGIIEHFCSDLDLCGNQPCHEEVLSGLVPRSPTFLQRLYRWSVYIFILDLEFNLLTLDLERTSSLEIWNFTCSLQIWSFTCSSQIWRELAHFKSGENLLILDLEFYLLNLDLEFLLLTLDLDRTCSLQIWSELALNSHPS